MLHGRCNLPWKPCLRRRIRWRGIDVAFKDTHVTTVNSHQSLFWRYFPWWSLLVSQFFSWSDAHPPFDSRVRLDCRSARVVNQEVLGSSQVTCFSLRNLLRIRLGSAVHVIRCQRRGKVGVRRKQLLFIFQVQELIAWCKKHSITSGEWAVIQGLAVAFMFSWLYSLECRKERRG